MIGWVCGGEKVGKFSLHCLTDYLTFRWCVKVCQTVCIVINPLTAFSLPCRRVKPFWALMTYFVWSTLRPWVWVCRTKNVQAWTGYWFNFCCVPVSDAESRKMSQIITFKYRVWCQYTDLDYETHHWFCVCVCAVAMPSPKSILIF